DVMPIGTSSRRMIVPTIRRLAPKGTTDNFQRRLTSLSSRSVGNARATSVRYCLAGRTRRQDVWRNGGSGLLRRSAQALQRYGNVGQWTSYEYGGRPQDTDGRRRLRASLRTHGC